MRDSSYAGALVVPCDLANGVKPSMSGSEVAFAHGTPLVLLLAAGDSPGIGARNGRWDATSLRAVSMRSVMARRRLQSSHRLLRRCRRPGFCWKPDYSYPR